MRIIRFVLFLFVVHVTFAQQLFHQTQFMINPYLLNPALAGSEDYVDIKAGYRTQWVGLNDDQGYSSDAINPRTIYLSCHTALGHDHGYYNDPKNEHKGFHGVGGFLTSDKLGEVETNTAYGSYSYNLLLIKSKRSFSANSKTDRPIGLRMIVGAHVGVLQFRVNFDELVTTSQLKQLGSDPYLNKELVNKWSPDASLGTWIYSNNFFTGLAIRRVIANTLTLNTNSDLKFDLSRHYNLMSGFRLKFSDHLKLEPSVNVKFENGAKSSIDLNAMIVYDNTDPRQSSHAKGKKMNLHIYTGATYRLGSSLAVLIGGVIDRKYELNYSFDLSVNGLEDYQSGSHEITLGWRIAPKSYLNAEDRTSRRHH